MPPEPPKACLRLRLWSRLVDLAPPHSNGVGCEFYARATASSQRKRLSCRMPGHALVTPRVTLMSRHLVFLRAITLFTTTSFSFFLWRLNMKNLSFLRKGILADQSAQDTIEYVIMATIVLGLGIIVYAILRSVMTNKSQDINNKWPAIG